LIARAAYDTVITALLYKLNNGALASAKPENRNINAAARMFAQGGLAQHQNIARMIGNVDETKR